MISSGVVGAEHRSAHRCGDTTWRQSNISKLKRLLITVAPVSAGMLPSDNGMADTPGDEQSLHAHRKFLVPASCVCPFVMP